MQPLKLEELEDLNFSTPQLYRKLVKLTNVIRNKYVPGTRGQGYLHQITNDEDTEEMSSKVLEEVIEPEDTAGQRVQSAPVANSVAPGETFQDVQDKWSQDLVFRSVPSFENPESGGDMYENQMGARNLEENQHHHQEPTNNRMRTRFGGQKHVKVYNSTIDLSIKRSTLKGNCYEIEDNFKVPLFRASDKFSFTARKSALAHHKQECSENFCKICDLATKIKNFDWDPASFGRYNLKSNLKEIIKIKSNKKVQFSNTVSFSQGTGLIGVNINLNNIFSACIHNVSFTELKYLTTS